MNAIGRRAWKNAFELRGRRGVGVAGYKLNEIKNVEVIRWEL